MFSNHFSTKNGVQVVGFIMNTEYAFALVSSCLYSDFVFRCVLVFFLFFIFLLFSTQSYKLKKIIEMGWAIYHIEDFLVVVRKKSKS